MKYKKKGEKLTANSADDAQGFFKKYAEDSYTIRVWFVTFGIGGLYLLLTNEKLLLKLKSTNDIRLIATLFLLGIGLQLVIAILNKWTNWYNYQMDGKYESWFAKFVSWLSNQFWIDILCDIVTCFCFGKIIWKMINVFSV